MLSPLLEHLQTNDFRQTTGALFGYNTAHSGEQVYL
jgi:hypothetical protein